MRFSLFEIFYTFFVDKIFHFVQFILVLYYLIESSSTFLRFRKSFLVNWSKIAHADFTQAHCEIPLYIEDSAQFKNHTKTQKKMLEFFLFSLVCFIPTFLFVSIPKKYPFEFLSGHRSIFSSGCNYHIFGGLRCWWSSLNNFGQCHKTS